MSVREPRDLFNKFADSSEELIQRLAEVPGADRFLGAAQAMRERMDDMQRRVRGIDALEARIAELERRLDEVTRSSGSKAPARRASSTPAKTGSSSKSSGSKSSASKSAAPKSAPAGSSSAASKARASAKKSSSSKTS